MHSATLLLDLEKQYSFKIEIIKTDNGKEFTNRRLLLDYFNIFEEVLMAKVIENKRMSSYSL